jgi:hypothetical protein
MYNVYSLILALILMKSRVPTNTSNHADLAHELFVVGALRRDAEARLHGDHTCFRSERKKDEHSAGMLKP